MMNIINRTLLFLALVQFPAQVLAAGAPATWDGLVEVEARRMDAAFLLPGADFRAYERVMIDPAEVAFRKDWLEDVNRSRPGVSRDLTAEDAARIAEAARSGVGDVFTEAFRRAGHDVVTAPGPDVLRLSPAIINLYINAPDAMADGQVRTYTLEAGEATLVLEARDSVSGALLGRVLDRRETRRAAGLQLTSSVISSSDFRTMFGRWAGIGVQAFDELKAESPVASAADARHVDATAPSAEDFFGRDGRQTEELALRATGGERVEQMSARVTEVGHSASGKLVLALDNGQVWSQVDSTRLRVEGGDEVRIRRALMDSFLLARADGGAAIRVRRNR
jgi:hypothetical protein